MTFCLHANQKTVSCGTWENSSSWKPCIPQRFPKICCTHGPHIGSKSFLPELSGLLGFCRVPQLANSLIKYVHVHRCKHEYIYTYIIYIYIYTHGQDTLTETHHATDTYHINATWQGQPCKVRICTETHGSSTRWCLMFEQLGDEKKESISKE